MVSVLTPPPRMRARAIKKIFISPKNKNTLLCAHMPQTFSFTFGMAHWKQQQNQSKVIECREQCELYMRDGKARAHTKYNQITSNDMQSRLEFFFTYSRIKMLPVRLVASASLFRAYCLLFALVICLFDETRLTAAENVHGRL